MHKRPEGQKYQTSSEILNTRFTEVGRGTKYEAGEVVKKHILRGS